MMSPAVARRAQELAAEGTAFVTATVVRAQRPTSVKAGDVALVLTDGTIEGFVGGVCAEQSVRAYALKAIETTRGVLLRIVPDGPIGEDPGTGQEVAVEEGAVTAQNPCLSGGAIEIFLEPVLPAPRVLVVGDTPIATAVVALAGELGLAAVAVAGSDTEPSSRRPGGCRRSARTRRTAHAAPRARAERALRRPRRQPPTRAGVLADLRSDGVPGPARADRHTRRARHRRPHPGRDRAVDPWVAIVEVRRAAAPLARDRPSIRSAA